ncbi:MAG: histidine--tRNA ligase [Bacillota bacterium]
MPIKKPRGVADILPGEVERWQRLESIVREITRIYGYQEIRTPVFEFTELFQRGVGEETDIVAKEMYTFTDRRGRSLSLRPEGTAAVVRSFIENSLFNRPQPVKLYYTGPMFRYDRPQAGRFRQFHQFGVEVFGSDEPAVDAEVIALLTDFFKRIGLKDLLLEINSVGCPKCRQELVAALREYFKTVMEKLCRDCKERVERNPLRLLDCKEEGCGELAKQAPVPLDFLCPGCRAHFAGVREELDVLGIAYVVNPRLVRGLDYYTGTSFEVLLPGIGAQSAIGAGGRYNNLVVTCGGPPTPGVGFAVGIERTLLALDQQGLTLREAEPPGVFVATAGEGAERMVAGIIQNLRDAGFPADREYARRSLKTQLKQANRRGSKWVVIAGEEELNRGKLALRDMDTGEQVEIDVKDLVSWLKQHDAGQTTGSKNSF